jgi:hypothetical protein
MKEIKHYFSDVSPLMTGVGYYLNLAISKDPVKALALLNKVATFVNVFDEFCYLASDNLPGYLTIRVKHGKCWSDINLGDLK